jgi:acetyltransferase-like isoleucine patch superfamily enzyme
MINIKLFILKVKNRIKRAFSPNISASASLARRVQIFGLDNIKINDNCTIGENTIITINDRSTKEIRFSIGSNTYIGRNNFFTIGQGMRIGEYCIFGNNCSFLCSDHAFETPLEPYLMSGYTFDKSINIGTNCWLGINVCIIGNVNIGHGCIIGANAMITKDIPPFSMVVGNPSKVIKRYDFEKQEWVKNLEVSNSIYLDEAVYLEYIRNKFGKLIIAYHSSSSQFGDL